VLLGVDCRASLGRTWPQSRATDPEELRSAQRDSCSCWDSDSESGRPSAKWFGNSLVKRPKTALKPIGKRPGLWSNSVDSQASKPGQQVIFFRFAKKNCCNFSAVGPRGEKDYCWSLSNPCLLAAGKRCKWFVEAVLPLDKALELEYHRTKKIASDPDSLPRVKRERTCLCGKRFLARNNRQIRCPKCAKEQRRLQLRNRVRKFRARKKARL
jgi:hypothetical protein